MSGVHEVGIKVWIVKIQIVMACMLIMHIHI